MLRHRKEPDPLSGKRKLLAEQERLLAERMAKLNARLANNGEEEAAPPKTPEPPVWRLEDDVRPLPRGETTASARRVLAAQRQRDKIIFFITMATLLVVVLLVLALAHSHLAGSLPRS
jgi:predicted nucleic acid-binding Zn ribbon protein